VTDKVAHPKFGTHLPRLREISSIYASETNLPELDKPIVAPCLHFGSDTIPPTYSVYMTSRNWLTIDSLLNVFSTQDTWPPRRLYMHDRRNPAYSICSLLPVLSYIVHHAFIVAQ